MSETYKFDNRVLEIEDESQASEAAKSLIKQVLIELFQQNEIMLKFRKLKVVLLDSDKRKLLQLKEIKNSLEYALSVGRNVEVRNFATNAFEEFKNIGINARADVKNGKIDFYADLVDILVTMENYLNELTLKKEIVQLIRATLAHEAVHMLENDISQNMRLMPIISARLENAMNKINANLSKLNILGKVSLWAIRDTLRIFIVKIKSEGLGRFVEYEASGRIIYSSNEFDSLYKQALIQAEVFRGNYGETLHKLDRGEYIGPIRNFFEANEYQIGLHMTYTILYFDKDTKIISLLEMSPFRFIEKYETLIKRHGERPIVSLTSKEGIIDYRSILESFAYAIRKFK